MTIALVTGAGGTVGCAIADRLADDGHVVVRTDLVGEDLDVVADLGEPDEIIRLCDEVEASHGPIDLLVNVAGIYGDRATFLDGDPQRWWEVLEVNLRAPVLLCRRLVPAMVARGRGLVVNVTSRAAAWDDPVHSSTAYPTSKAALARFTESIAAEVDGTGVIVVHVSPGFVRSAMTDQRPDVENVPSDAFVPPTAIAGVVAAIAGGGRDELHGHFVHALDDLDRLARSIGDDPRVRRLSFTTYGHDDPIG